LERKVKIVVPDDNQDDNRDEEPVRAGSFLSDESV
jgi:hypothetical protein